MKIKLRKTQNRKTVKTLWQKLRAIGRTGRQVNLSVFIAKDRKRE